MSRLREWSEVPLLTADDQSCLPPTPVDTLSGIPLCFVPCPDLPPPGTPPVNGIRVGDWNHVTPRSDIHASTHPLHDEMTKRALLGMRIQWVPFDWHHEEYNPRFSGPELPVTRESLAAAFILALGNYIPPMALNFSNDEPTVDELSRQERLTLLTSGQVRMSDELSVVSWLRRYMFEQSVDHVRRDKLERFLYTFDDRERIDLTHYLGAKIIERAVEPIDAIYREAWRTGGLPPGAPRHSRDIVKQALMRGRRLGPVASEMHRRFRPHGRSRTEWLEEWLASRQEPVVA